MNLGDLKRRVWRPLQKILQAPIIIVRKSEDKMPGAFIIAPFRSGTTLLRYIFDSHSKIAAPPETYIFAPLLSPLNDKRLIDTMWNLGFHRDALAAALGDCCRGFVETYAKSKGKSFWVEKTPSYVGILPELREAFLDSKFIMLYRHPFDIVQSMMDREMAKVQPEIASYRPRFSSAFSACCAYVSDQHEVMLKFQNEHPDITFELRYENITLHPEREIRNVCEFFGLDFEPDMINFDDALHDTGFEDEKIRKTRGIIPRTKTYGAWTQEQQVEALKFLQKDLDSLGYRI